MTSNIISKGILQAIGIVLGIFLLLYFLFEIQTVIIYIAIAAVISLIASPIIAFLKNKLKFPNTLAVLVSMILFIGVFAGLFSLFIPLIIEQGENLSLLNTNQFQDNIQNLLIQVNDYFLANDIDLLNELKNLDFMNQLEIIPNILNSVIGTVGSFGVGLFSVIFISFYFMKDTHLLENSIYVMANDESESKVRKSIRTIKHLLSRYFIGLVFQITILLIIYYITLLIFDVQNAFVIAFLCALLNLIPYVGPMISAVLIVFLTMSSNLGQDFQTVILPKTIYVMIGFMVAQLIDNFLSQPLIFSNSVKSHPLEIFLVIIISGILFGVLGMVVAIPTYTAIKVILKEFLSENKIVKSLTKNI